MTLTVSPGFFVLTIGILNPREMDSKKPLNGLFGRKSRCSKMPAFFLPEIRQGQVRNCCLVFSPVETIGHPLWIGKKSGIVFRSTSKSPSKR